MQSARLRPEFSLPDRVGAGPAFPPFAGPCGQMREQTADMGACVHITLRMSARTAISDGWARCFTDWPFAVQGGSSRLARSPSASPQ
jgi:hypothetical protein